MIKLKPNIQSLLGAFAILIAGSAHADLLEYSFTGADGSHRKLTPSETFANPTGTITFALSAGVDRKVRMSIVNSAGSIISSSTSNLLGANDRITVDGREYYGAYLKLEAPGEGSYVFKAEILSGDNQPVKTDNYSVNIDRTPPTASQMIATNSGYGQVTSGSIWKLGLGGSNTTYFRVTDVFDASPVKEAKVSLYRADGSLHFERAANYDIPSKRVDVANMSGFFPSSNLNENFKVQISVTDQAGNNWKSQLQTVLWDDITNAPTEPFGVYDPDSNNVLGPGLNKFVPYQPGMTVKTNPIRLAYRVPKNNWFEYSEGGISLANALGENKISGTDSQYVYIIWSAPIDNTNGNYTRWVNFGQWGGAGIDYNLKLSSSAPKTPTITSVDYHYSDIGWSSFYRQPINKSLLPLSFDKIRFSAEARSFNQVANHMGSCTIPAGQTSCIINTGYTMNPGTTGYLHDAATLRSEDGTLSASVRYAEVNWNDLYYPSINYNYDEKNKVVTAFVNQPGRGSYFDRLRLSDAWIEDVTGNRLTVTGGLVEENGANYTYRWDLKSLSEGTYQLYAASRENHGPVTKIPMFTFTSDKTPPQLTIKTTSNEKVSSLDQFLVQVSDTYDLEPRITSINLSGGPAMDNVQLSWRKESPGNFRLEYPIMFPSMKVGEEYTITVIASDAQGNQVEKIAKFMYEPQQMSLADGMDGKLMIPAVAQEFQRLGGGHIIQTEPITLGGDTVVTGSYDVFATLRSDAEVPLVVNGIRIEPGQTMSVMSKHNFGNSGGRINLPLRPAISNVKGSSNLLVMTSAPNSPVLVLDVNTWTASAKLSAESWNVRQVVDPVKIYALPEVGVPCRFTTKQSEAMAADPIRDPVCLIQWDRAPDEAEQAVQDNNGLKVAGLVGQAVSVGEQPVEYSLYLFSGDGSKVKVGSGSQNLTVTSAYGSIGYTPGESVSQVNRVIETFDVNFKQAQGPDCSLTLNADRAKKEASTKPVGSASRSCLFEWQQIPDGLTQDQFSESPSLSGSLAENGSHPLGWRVSIFTRNGTRVTLNDQTFNIEAVDPPVPTIELSSKFLFKDNIYMVPTAGNYLGDAIINADRAELDVAISRNTDVLESETFSPGWGATNKVYRRINTDERALWEETTYKVDAAYNKVPEVKAGATYKVISAPSDSIKPIIEVAGNTAIDTQALQVRVLIRDQYKPDAGYNADTMGAWKVRLIRQKAYNETEALTDYAVAANGETQFAVDLSGVDTSSVRITAEAVLESPVDGYSRTELSIRPAFLTVLRGGVIGADVQARRLSGEAPFTAVFKLSLSDRHDLRATGQVIWETSKDKGATWESFTPEDRYKYQLVKTFEKGEYQVRAKVINVNSGAEQYTELVNVIAYDKPQISVAGPTTLFVGSEGNYTANLTLNDETVPTDNSVVEWSTDGGKTYTQTGSSINLTSVDETRFRLWARVRSTAAPADDGYAYEVAKTAVDFRSVKAPRPYVTGPKVVETGKTYIFKAETSLPYSGMDVKLGGFFTLPNGAIVQGDTAEYTPTDADLNLATVDTTYTTWIEGYRDQGAEATHSLRSRVWQYVWPTFGMQVRKNADVAPATITASVRPIAFNGKLEEPVYEWELPEGAVIQDQKQDISRSFLLKEPGDYTITVKVRDVRGNESTIEQQLTIGKAVPYAIELQYSGSNKHEREPLDVLLRPYISGGHPRDRISTRSYSVNGAPLDNSGFYGRATLGAGEHNIKLKITSEMGHSAEGEVSINVAENKLPACSLSSRETVGSWIVYASCEDTDGRLKSYEWTIAGELQSISSDRITINKGNYQGMPTITLIGVDDSGGRSEAVSLN